MPRHDAANMQPCVYILASRRNGTLYVGVTSDLNRRISVHRANVINGFTKRYAVQTLLYAKFHATTEAAILREKRVNTWRRAWKLKLIENANPNWRGLYDEVAR